MDMKTVTIKDGSLRANKTIMITPAMRLQFAKEGNYISPTYKFLPAINEKTREKLQDIVTVDRVFTGAHLDNTIKRAKRYIRSKAFADRVMPARHIDMAMAVFNKYDRKAFAREAFNRSTVK